MTSDGTPTPSIAESKPISDSLQRHLDEVLSRIPTGRTAIVSAGVTTTGVVASIGAKKSFRGAELQGSGYAGKVWNGSGWEAGARASVVF